MGEVGFAVESGGLLGKEKVPMRKKKAGREEKWGALFFP